MLLPNNNPFKDLWEYKGSKKYWIILEQHKPICTCSYCRDITKWPIAINLPEVKVNAWRYLAINLYFTRFYLRVCY
jgi:hypothetical protein